MSDDERRDDDTALVPSGGRELISTRTNALARRGLALIRAVASDRHAEAGKQLKLARDYWEKAIATDWSDGWLSDDTWQCVMNSLSAYRHGLTAAATALDVKSNDTTSDLARNLFHDGKLRTDISPTLDWLEGLPVSRAQFEQERWEHVDPDSLEELLVELEAFLQDVTKLIQPMKSGDDPEQVNIGSGLGENRHASGTTDVVMPQLGESVTEGTIIRWMKKVGEKVERDEPLFEISTDKVDAEIPAPASGILQEILAQEGETVSVYSIVAVMKRG